MGRAKGVVLLPPSPLTCIIPCMLLFSPLPSLLVTQGDKWGKESNTVAVFIETFLIPAPPPPHRPSVTLAKFFYSPHRLFPQQRLPLAIDK